MKNCIGSVPSSASQSSSYLIWERNPTLKAVSAPRELLGARHSEKRVETFSSIFMTCAIIQVGRKGMVKKFGLKSSCFFLQWIEKPHCAGRRCHNKGKGVLTTTTALCATKTSKQNFRLGLNGYDSPPPDDIFNRCTQQFSKTSLIYYEHITISSCKRPPRNSLLERFTESVSRNYPWSRVSSYIGKG